jgi:antitoxin HicB
MWYQIVLDADDNDTFVVTVPAFPEITTFGESQPDACLHGIAAIEEAIAARMADGEDIPAPLVETTGKGHFVEVPALAFLKSALYAISRAQNVNRAELARRLDWHREQVDRLFRLDHNSRLDQLEAAFKALGTPLRFSLPFPVAA